MNLMIESYRTETHVSLRRADTELFVARVKYQKHKSRANRLVKALKASGLNLETVTQAELDAFRLNHYRSGATAPRS